MTAKRGHNRNKAFLLNRLKDMYGEDFEPVIKMAESAVTMQIAAKGLQEQVLDDDGKIKDPEDYLKLLTTLEKTVASWDKVAAYTNAKLKSVELSQDPENPLFEGDDAALERRFRGILQTAYGAETKSDKPH